MKPQVTRCKLCLIPDTRPDTPFDDDGVCPACKTHEKQKAIDWAARKRDLEELLTRGRNASGYDCIVASSGGKDSTYQVMSLIDMGVKPLVVTATTCHLTPIGRHNIDNLSRFADTVEVTPNRHVRHTLNRIGLQRVGDISWPEHVAIFTTPVKASVQFGIPLVFYGENPQAQYGGPKGSEIAREMTRRWVAEFGGFLGMRPADMVGQEGLTENDMLPYIAPRALDLERARTEAHFLGQYLGPWDPHKNAEVARRAGMIQHSPSIANWWNHENLDNAQTGLHDYMCYLKYGFGRATAQLSVDIRLGLITRAMAESYAEKLDAIMPEVYAGVPLSVVLNEIGVSRQELAKIFERFTNHVIFKE